MMERAIATASDAAYFVGLRVMLNSLRVHAPELPVFIFDCGLSAQQLHYLRAQGYHLVVPQGLDGPQWGHVSRATYARFSSCFLPARKILYLDADIVVVGFLDELFAYDCPLGVCREDGVPMWTNFHGNAALGYYGINRDSQAFNGGVFLLDVYYWRERFYQEYLGKISQWGHECKFADQSCLHLIAYEKGEFMFIPKKWNTFHYELEKYPDFRIVHFHMNKKPWHDHFEHQDALQLWKMYV
jgi:lipopolysaccharide biosynthesis glycosyltransferase